MPLDSITISALCAELGAVLTDARIDKVQQPERDTVLLSLRGERSFRLLLCGGVGTARAHITEAAFENPAQPPMFCMLLRKHLTGARIAAVEQPARERILTFWLEGRDELGFSGQKRLILELIGRGTNLILADGKGVVIDCLRRVDAEMNPRRQVLPGLRYRPPERQAKPDFFALDAGERRALWERRGEDDTAAKWLMDTFSGLSPLICREMEHRGLPEAMDALSERVSAGEFTPYMLLQDGRPKDFFCLPIAQYGAAMEGEIYPSFSALLDAFYTRRGQAEEMRRKTSALRRTVKSAHDRALRKLALQTEELARTGQREELRRRADLITANLYRAPKGGAREMTVEDFYEEGSPAVTIPLDPLKTPQQNAAAYYKEYNKAKTAEKYLTALIAENRADADYLASVLDELDRARGAADVAAIRAELTAAGFLREREKKGGKKEKIKEAAPLRYVSSGGYEILVGRNNAQNDALTLRSAHKGDLWFHTQKIHGSHVILRCAGETPDEDSLREAASLAALHSQAAAGGRVPVDYTRVKLVKKPAGARPGMVVYTGQTTLAAEADEALAEKLLFPH